MPASEKSLSEVIRDRRATASYESQPVADGDLRRIIAAGRHAPSGYNLQPWRFVVVRDAEQRKKLREAAMGQPKVSEAPVVIVACGDTAGWRNGDLDEMLKLAGEHGYGSAAEHAMVRKAVTGLLGGAPGSAGGLAPDVAVWVNRQVMIALTHMMLMAEALGYDTAPMEGFFEDKVKTLLHIPDPVRVVALLTIGKRKGEKKPFGGRFEMAHTVFGEDWDKPLDLA